MPLGTRLLFLATAIGLSASRRPQGLLALTHGALLQSSQVWLSVLKWVGGAYLVSLGVQV
jgi:homoserine/homoserine lactone efflux protein